jgi:alpha-N-arabinofuranosidase
VILTDEEKLILTPTYHVLDMYKVHQDAVLIPLEIKTGEYTFGDEKLPAISVSASQKDGNINISLVNIHAKESIEVVVELGSPVSIVSGQILKAAKIDAHNTFENPQNIRPIKFEGAKISGNTMKVKLPPVSVVVLSLK